MSYKCEFHINFNEPADQLVNQMRAEITKTGGSFQGDTHSGSCSIPTPVGSVEGNYSINAQVIAFFITKKPVIVSCSKIEGVINKFINTHSAEHLNFEVADAEAEASEL